MANVPGRNDTDRNDTQDGPVIRTSQSAPFWHVRDSQVVVSISQKVYSLKAILAASYKLSDTCAVLIDSEGDDRWSLFLIGIATGAGDAVVARLLNELVDQQLRVLLEQEFGAVRTLIVAQAFSEGNLIGPDDDRSEDGSNS